jgi:hypothetical protein
MDGNGQSRKKRVQTQGRSLSSRKKHAGEHAQDRKNRRRSTQHAYEQFLHQEEQSARKIKAEEERVKVATKYAKDAASDALAAAKQAASAAKRASEADARAATATAHMTEVSIREAQQKSIYLAVLESMNGDTATVVTKTGMHETVRLVGNVRIEYDMLPQKPFVLIVGGALKGVLEDADQIRMAKKLGWKSSQTRSANSIFTSASRSRSTSSSRSRSGSRNKIPSMFGKRAGSLSPISE